MTQRTRERVTDSASAAAHIGRVQARFPKTKSAYVPSGRMPIAAIAALGLGTALGVPAGALAGMVLGGISLALVALIGLALGAMAAVCGRVLCIVALLELVVALGGAVVTFGGIGLVSAMTVAWAGKLGKNRNAWAALVAVLPSAFVAYLLVVAVPQLAAMLVGPADPSSDFALSSIVHVLSDFGWTTAALYGLGLLVTMGVAAFSAHDQVGQQKFCEPCERYMDESSLPDMTYDVGAWVIDAVRRGGAQEIAPQIPRAGGGDVSAKAFACPGCGSGFFEVHARALAEWTSAKGELESKDETWLCVSIPLRADDTRALVAAKSTEPT